MSINKPSIGLVVYEIAHTILKNILEFQILLRSNVKIIDVITYLGTSNICAWIMFIKCHIHIEALHFEPIWHSTSCFSSFTPRVLKWGLFLTKPFWIAPSDIVVQQEPAIHLLTFFFIGWQNWAHLFSKVPYFEWNARNCHWLWGILQVSYTAISFCALKGWQLDAFSP